MCYIRVYVHIGTLVCFNIHCVVTFEFRFNVVSGETGNAKLCGYCAEVPRMRHTKCSLKWSFCARFLLSSDSTTADGNIAVLNLFGCIAASFPFAILVNWFT